QLEAGDRHFDIMNARSYFSAGVGVMRDELAREDVAGAIDRMVEELLRRGGVEQPPVDAIALAQRALGMLVCLDRRQPQRGRAQRAAGKPIIYLKPEPTEE